MAIQQRTGTMVSAQQLAGRCQRAISARLLKADSDPLLTSQPPAFTEDEATGIAERFFDVKATAKPLWSERDQNFRLSADTGEKFVLKIANALESPGVIDFQIRALEHIALSNPALPVPRTISTSQGEDYCLVKDSKGRDHMVRLISWLEGQIIEEAELSADLSHTIGQVLASLGNAMRDFSHPAANHHLLWDLKHTAELNDLLPYIDDRDLRSLLAATLSTFEQNVLPHIGDLRAQIIHADLNRGNILLSAELPQRVTGIIDFGDMVHTPLIMDLAIAAAYHLGETGDPLGNALNFIRGYHEITPLEKLEARLLFDLMTARLCTSITVQMWRVKLYPENEEYLMIHNDQVIKTLKNATSGNAQQYRKRILEVCGYN